MSATAVILQNRFSNDGAIILSVVVDGHMVHESWNHTVNTNDARAQMIDAFLDLWNDYCEQGLVLYVSSRTVRNLLKEQQELFDGLLIREPSPARCSVRPGMSAALRTTSSDAKSVHCRARLKRSQPHLLWWQRMLPRARTVRP